MYIESQVTIGYKSNRYNDSMHQKLATLLYYFNIILHIQSIYVQNHIINSFTSKRLVSK